MSDIALVVWKHGAVPTDVRRRLPATWRTVRDWGGTLVAVRDHPRAGMRIDAHGEFASVQISRVRYRKTADISSFWSDLGPDHLINARPMPESSLRPCLDLNGHFCLFLIGDGCVIAITDRGGAVPVFFASTPHGFFASTNPNLVAILSGQNDPDVISINDFILNGAICHPYSWFMGVRAVNPGSALVYQRERPGADIAYYWRPGGDDPLTIEDAALLLREELRENIRSATEGAARVSFLYSGGEDARVVASLVPPALSKEGYIFLAERNREYLLAYLSGKLLGVDLKLLRRDGAHYAADLEEKQDLTGYGCDLFHAHAYGFEERIAGPVVLGGYGSDSWLKGRYARKGMPRFGHSDLDLCGPYAGEVLERRTQRQKCTEDAFGVTGSEWQWIWPISGLKAYSHFALNRRRLPMCEPYIYSNIIALASRISLKDKISQELFRLAFRGNLGAAGLVPTSTKRIPAMSRIQNHIVRPFVASAFALQMPFGSGARGQGAWTGRADFLKCESYKRMLAQYQVVLKDFDCGRFDEWRDQFGSRKVEVGAGLSHRFLQAAAAISRGASAPVAGTDVVADRQNAAAFSVS